MTDPGGKRWPAVCSKDILFDCFEGDEFASTYPYKSKCLEEEDYNSVCYNPCKDKNPFQPVSSDLFNVSKDASMERITVYGGSDTGNATAYNGGDIYNPQKFTLAANSSLLSRYPPGSWVELTNPRNGKKVMAQITDLKGNPGLDATPAIFNALGEGYGFYKAGRAFGVEVRNAKLKNEADFTEFIRVEFSNPFFYEGTNFTNSCRKGSKQWPEGVREAMSEEWRLNEEFLAKYAQDYSGQVFTQLAVGADHVLQKQFIEMRIAIPDDPSTATDLLFGLHEYYKKRGIDVMFGIFRETENFDPKKSNRTLSYNVPDMALDVYHSECMDTPEGEELLDHIIMSFGFTFEVFTGEKASNAVYAARKSIRSFLEEIVSDPKKINFTCNKSGTNCRVLGSRTIFPSLGDYVKFIEEIPDDKKWEKIKFLIESAHLVGKK